MTDIDLSDLAADRDGSRPLRGYLASPAGTGPWPAVVMIHEIFGLDDVMRGHADRLAGLGYLTLAVDLFSAGSTARCLVTTMTAMIRGHGRAFADIDVKEYPAASHSFLNDTETGPRALRPLLRVAGIGPEPESAKDAWNRIELFFATHLN